LAAVNSGDKSRRSRCSEGGENSVRRDSRERVTE
jgi:hypothetical protein